jgi:hypothetical protein
MSDHTLGKRGDGDAPGSDAPAGQSLQPEYTFVVQLRGGPATSRQRLQGRVEHVVSGEVVRFRSTAELVEFLARGGVPASSDA